MIRSDCRTSGVEHLTPLSLSVCWCGDGSERLALCAVLDAQLIRSGSVSRTSGAALLCIISGSLLLICRNAQGCASIGAPPPTVQQLMGRRLLIS